PWESIPTPPPYASPRNPPSSPAWWMSSSPPTSSRASSPSAPSPSPSRKPISRASLSPRSSSASPPPSAPTTRCTCSSPGPATPPGLKASDIFLLVRGTVDRSTTRTRISGSSATKQAGGLATLGGAAFGAVIPGGVDISHTTEIHLTQLLDIYLTDHSLLRLN